ncbi:MAG TPA: hypothetical protein VJZ71_18315 [Phycisphaerae bacterium]|nr:hypothetical protein [Phycisphaerae bacterium]
MPGAERKSPLRAIDYVLAIALFLAAIAVRWPLISRGETLLHSDEAIVGLMAQDIAAGERFPIYFYGQRYMGALEAYVIAAISPLIDNPITALRMGPALFFAALVAVQYLMLTRLFGRHGGLIGAATLLVGSPMFAQWSISARGGYIEVLLWGSLLLWSYSEWFSRGAFTPSAGEGEGGGGVGHPTACKLMFGLLLGSGFWLNPSIVLFAAPIALHSFLIRAVPHLKNASPVACRLADRLGVATLPTLALAAILAMNCLYAVWVENGRVHQMLLLNLLPKPAAVAVIAFLFAGLAYYLRRLLSVAVPIALAPTGRRIVAAGEAADSGATRGKRSNRNTPRPEGAEEIPRTAKILAAAGPLILGALLGAAPAALYAARTALGLQPMEPSLPLGLRPLWETGPTLSILWHGLPLLFGADARPFLELVTIGRPTPLTSLGLVESAVVSAANLVVLGGGLTCAMVLVIAYRRPLAKLLRVDVAPGPVPLLALCFGTTLALFLLGGCTHDFNTIRYLIPLWAILPGLLAAIFVASPLSGGRRIRFVFAARMAPLCLLAAWAVGQAAMAAQLGRPHPLRTLSDALVEKKIDHAVAEIFDAHLLSYLTGQRCRVAEFDPFWSRLSHYGEQPPPAASPAAGTGASQTVDYIVRTSPIPADSTPWQYPGPPPPETTHPLWPRLCEAMAKDQTLCLLREPLVGGYERIRLAKPLSSGPRR